MAAHLTASDLPVDDWLCVALADASHAMTARYRELLTPLGLTYPQYILLSWLWQEGEQSVSELADRMGLDRSTLSPLVKRLESAGLVQRERDPEDERRVVVSTTRRGSAMRTRVQHVPAAVGAATGMSVDAQLELATTLRRLTATLSAN